MTPRPTTLVVDLDGTLTPTDTLVESIVKVIRHSPLHVFRLPLWLLQGRARFKAALAGIATPSVEHLPYRDTLLAYLQSEKARGRRLVLATAAHSSIADQVAAHLGLFDAVLATSGDTNLKGAAKLSAIRQLVGDDFVYAGDSRADLPVWRAARAAILVEAPGRVAAAVKRSMAVEAEFGSRRTGVRVWLRALRVHQWLKNLLLFVPLLTAFSFDFRSLATVSLAFLALSLTASATYLLNDVWDLEDDRRHPRKRLRPLASATLPVVEALAAAAAALVIGVGMAMAVSAAFAAMVLVYLALTTAYSWLFKRQVLVDVLMLSLLYTLRILAGAVAVAIVPSAWLLAFSVFLFLSLALIKRCAELVLLDDAGATATRGRDYRVSDLVVLWPLGVGSALCAVVVFGLFISAPETQQRYAMPQLLWLVAIGLIYWLARLWVKTSRGEMDDDPVIYAIRDRGSRVAIGAMIATTLVAHFVGLPVVPR